MSNFLRKNVYIAFTALFAILFSNVIFNNMHFDYKWYVVLPLAAVWFVAMVAVCKIINKNRAFIAGNEMRLMALFFVILAVTQVFYFTQLASYPSRDLENVFRSAYYYAVQGAVDPLNTDYLYKHPNNLPWVISFQFIFRIARRFGADAYMAYIIIATVVNAVAIALAYLFTYLLCRKTMGVTQGFMAIILLYSCLPLQFNISFFYTDTLTMPFIPLALLFYAVWSEKPLKQWLPLLAVFAMIIAYGIQLKYSVVIVVIAVLIDMVLKLDIKRLVAYCGAVLAAFVLWQNIFNSFTYSHILDKTLAEDAATPFLSYIMMGLNGDGSFNVDDRYYAWSFATKEEKEENIKQQIAYRLGQHTPVTFLQHLNQKGVRSFGSGNMEYNFTISNSPVRQTYLVQCVSPGTDSFVWMGNIVQGWHIMLFLLVIASAVISLKKGDFTLFLPILSILGLYLFLLLWESSQRYLINYMCMYVVCAVYVLNGIVNKNK